MTDVWIRIMARAWYLPSGGVLVVYLKGDGGWWVITDAGSQVVGECGLDKALLAGRRAAELASIALAGHLATCTTCELDEAGDVARACPEGERLVGEGA